MPLILPGFSDSNWFRTAFPDCVAYGFFPQRHQSLLHSAPLVHNANERIDVRDLGFAARLLPRLHQRPARLSRRRLLGESPDQQPQLRAEAAFELRVGGLQTGQLARHLREARSARGSRPS